MLRDLLVAKIVCFTTHSKHEIIVGKFSVGGNDFVVGGHYLRYFGQTNVDIRHSLKYFPEWERDIGRLQPGAGYLVKKRLKLMMVLFVDKQNAIIRSAKLPGQ